MVLKRFQRRRATQDISISEWDGAVEEALSGTNSAGSGNTLDESSPPGTLTRGSSSGEEQQSADEEYDDDVAPQMDIDAIRASIERKNSMESDEDDKVAHVSSVGEHPPNRSSRGRRASFNELLKPAFRRPSVDTTVGASSSASRTSYSSSANTNIWSKLMGGQSGVWDGLDGKNVFDDDDFDDDDSVMGMGGPHMVKKGAKYCRDNMRICGLGWWYETRHFLKTIWRHPHILLVSLVAFAVVCGVGMVAVTSEKNASIQKQMMTAEFIVSILVLIIRERHAIPCNHSFLFLTWSDGLFLPLPNPPSP